MFFKTDERYGPVTQSARVGRVPSDGLWEEMSLCSVHPGWQCFDQWRFKLASLGSEALRGCIVSPCLRKQVSKTKRAFSSLPFFLLLLSLFIFSCFPPPPPINHEDPSYSCEPFRRVPTYYHHDLLLNINQTSLDGFVPEEEELRRTWSPLFKWSTRVSVLKQKPCVEGQRLLKKYIDICTKIVCTLISIPT